MSCKGLKNSALRKCMKKYVEESKRRFPNFNKEKDTVITTSGTNRSAVKGHHTMKLQAYGQGQGESNNSYYNDGSYTSRNKVKKKK
jgi:hypothetical protein